MLALIIVSGCETAKQDTEVASLPTAHIVKICTERDCGPTLSIRLAGTVPDAYSFIVESTSGAQREVHCQDGIGDYGSNHFASMSYLECQSNGVQFVNFSPKEMTITVRWQDGEYSQAVTPDYRISYPNGPRCQPECHIGSTTVTIPTPTGGS